MILEDAPAWTGAVIRSSPLVTKKEEVLNAGTKTEGGHHLKEDRALKGDGRSPQALEYPGP